VPRLFLLLAAAISLLSAQTGENVLLVVNRGNAASREIGEYYRQKRGLPARNVCFIDTTAEETIDWRTYTREIEAPVADCLKKNGLTEKALYLATTLGVPLRIDGAGGNFQSSEHSSVDSDLSLLYAKLKGSEFPRAGVVPNPFYGKRDGSFQHPLFPIYLVTRLAAFDVADVKAMIDRSLAARNRGKFVIDLNSPGNNDGNAWLRAAALLLPKDRVILDETTNVLYGQRDVIGYASWGSNDDGRKQRYMNFQWLPGAVVTEYVSTNGRTMKRPADSWNLNLPGDSGQWFGSAQSLSADYIREGATGASGNVYEPFLGGCARPEYLLPAYASGRTLAESYYMALPFLSWQGIVLGDPLCVLKKP